MPYRILIVDNDKVFSENIEKTLSEDGFQVFFINSSNLVLEEIRKVHPHLILMDIELPEIDGIELCQTIRETSDISDTPISFLTNHTEDYVQITAYKAGCDDYIFKSIKPRVLSYRIMALLKRNNNKKELLNQSNSNIPNDNFIIDSEKFMVFVGDKRINLPKKQFLLLQLMASHPSKVFTREKIFELLWGKNAHIGSRTIDVYIRKIREQVGDSYIKTIKGVGYQFEQVPVSNILI